MNVAIGSDHGGYELKKALIDHLKNNTNINVEDAGCFSTDSVDYPDFAIAVGRRVTSGSADIGVMIDGAGVGSTMAANKIPGVRAALCNDIYTAGNAREHNNANMLVMGSMVVGKGKAVKILDQFLTSRFQGGRHEVRVNKINALDQESETGSISERSVNSGIQDIVRKVIASLGSNIQKSVAGSAGYENQDVRASSTVDLITEDTLRFLVKSGKREIKVDPKALITPLAKDYARDHKITIVN